MSHGQDHVSLNIAGGLFASLIKRFSCPLRGVGEMALSIFRQAFSKLYPTSHPVILCSGRRNGRDFAYDTEVSSLFRYNQTELDHLFSDVWILRYGESSESPAGDITVAFQDSTLHEQRTEQLVIPHTRRIELDH